MVGLPRGWGKILGKIFLPMLDSAGQGVIILTKSAALYFVLMGLSAPLGHV